MRIKVFKLGADIPWLAFKYISHFNIMYVMINWYVPICLVYSMTFIALENENTKISGHVSAFGSCQQPFQHKDYSITNRKVKFPMIAKLQLQQTNARKSKFVLDELHKSSTFVNQFLLIVAAEK